MTHYPETPWNLTPRQQESMEAFAEHGTVRLAAQAMDANENTVQELLRQAKTRMGAVSLTAAALMYDRLKRGFAPAEPKDDWIHARVTKGQAEWIKERGGSKFLRNLIEPKRIEDVWGRA